MKRKEKIYDLHFKAMEKFGLISETKMSKRNNRKEVPVLQMIGASDESRSSQNIVKMFKMLKQELAKKKKISFDPLNLFSESSDK